MATPPNLKEPISAGTDDGFDNEQTTDAIDNNVHAEDTSEISMRINLLGKLIIPPLRADAPIFPALPT